MKFQERPFTLFILVSLFLVLINCRQELPPPAVLQAAILAQDWNAIDAAATDWLARRGSPRAASILQGYAALARGDATAGQKFLRARFERRRVSELRWLEELAARHTDCAAAQLLGADALARRGERQSALAHLDAALVLDSDFALARLARGLLRAIVGDRAGALQDLDALPANSSVAAEAMVARGLLKLEAGELAEAMADLDAALMIEPEHAVALNARGVACAKHGAWAAAADNFASAYRFAPEMSEAKQNWQLAKQAADERSAAVSAQWHLGVFGTGILSEADFDYAKAHARDLIPGREHAYVYLTYRGELPFDGGVEKMRQRGIDVVVADPKNPQSALSQLDHFFKQSMNEGKNPVIFSDIHKIVPGQLGNQKETATTFPAQIIAQANAAFYREVRQRGDLPFSTQAAHSDATRVEIQAAILAEKLGAPFTRAIVESPRLEDQVDLGLRRAPDTHFTVVQPVLGDLFTSEAQGRYFGQGQRDAYKQTVDHLKGIKASNYDLLLIMNPSATSPSLLNPAGAHGDSASLGRVSQVEHWGGGEKIGVGAGPLGQILSRDPATQPISKPTSSATQPGGVLAGPTQMARSAAGQVVFSASGDNREFELVYPLFGKE